MARVDRAARVAKGQRGAAIDVPREKVSPFPPDEKRLGSRFRSEPHLASAHGGLSGRTI
jgi:hypothetical protein